MKYDHKFTCQILLLPRNKGRNGLYFGHFDGRKTALYWNVSSFGVFGVLPKGTLFDADYCRENIPANFGESIFFLLALMSMSAPVCTHRQLSPWVLCCGGRWTDAPPSRHIAAGDDEAQTRLPVRSLRLWDYQTTVLPEIQVN
jgi:hypothetical protein